MSWKDLLQKPNETTIQVWISGRVLRSFDRTWTIEGKLPPEPGWHEFRVEGRKARWFCTASMEPEKLRNVFSGYLVGHRIVPDGVSVNPDVDKIASQSEEVFFLPDGLDRFARVKVGQSFDDGPYVFISHAFPLGAEDEVLTAFLDEKESISDVKGVAPALDAAFRLEVYQRIETKRRREELERLRRIEEEKRAVEERRQNLVNQLGNSVGRRAMAMVDFDEAARAALAVGGATFLDARNGASHGEMVVRFRYQNRRFECTCDKETFSVIDSGICLTDHNTGEKTDSFFTLESLPGVIKEAIDDDKLVIYRHA